jgi:hypothetical protein
LGARQSTADILAFIDSDCLIDATYLLRAWDVLKATGAAATGSKHQLPEDPVGWIEGTWHALHLRPEDGWANYIPSGNLVVRREAFEEVGGFDPTLQTGEDAEFCQRLNAGGDRVYSSSRVSARHLGNPKTILAFVRRERWHGLGMLGTLRGNPLDKVFWLTACHILAVLTAAYLVGLRGAGAAPAALGLAEAAPAAALIFRWAQQRRIVRPFRSLVLYNLYVWARAGSLAALAWRWIRSHLTRRH